MQVSADLLSAMNDAHCPLRFVIERLDSAVILSAGGEVDMSNVVLWQRLLSEVATATGAPGVLIVDTNALTFMGGCAYAALVQQASQCRRRGIDLVLVSGQATVARLLRRNRWIADLTLYPDVRSAVAASETKMRRLGDAHHTPPNWFIDI